ncbi:hypothetical protein RDJ12_07490 [Mergibacter septicus]|nr:hypothetical protein [Mergibacter septicus]UTU48606.1 hypothetical protein HLL31_07520 [Mergibacter septicus]WMR95765.1 hypothetical protein RDJ12_07490 [Mergibacter septicus]
MAYKQKKLAKKLQSFRHHHKMWRLRKLRLRKLYIQSRHRLHFLQNK